MLQYFSNFQSLKTARGLELGGYFFRTFNVTGSYIMKMNGKIFIYRPEDAVGANETNLNKKQ